VNAGKFKRARDRVTQVANPESKMMLTDATVEAEDC
jgi:hypothetical protein